MKEYTFYKESVRQETGSHPLSTVTLKEDGSQATLTFLKVFVYKKKKKKKLANICEGHFRIFPYNFFLKGL